MVDHFARLGLPRRFALDLADLEQAYLTHARQSHPDYHAGTADPVRIQATSAEVNDARGILRDPLRRAEHLLTLLGAPVAGATPQNPEFLIELMEVRERLDSGEAITVIAELAARELIETANLAATLDASPPDLPQARAALDRWKTLASLQREARARRDDQSDA